MAGWAVFRSAAWKVLKVSWPLALQAWAAIDDFVKKHPEVPDRVKRNLAGWRTRFASAQQKRSAGARVRATLETIRGLADELAVGDAAGERPVEWRRRADGIEKALELAESRQGGVRKRMIARVVARTDALAAEAFESLIPDDESASTDAPAESGQSADDEQSTPEGSSTARDRDQADR